MEMIIIGTVIGSAIGTLFGIFVLEPAFSRLLDAWDDWRQCRRGITRTLHRGRRL